LCKLALGKTGIELVGAVERVNLGRDVGEVIGLGKAIGVRLTDNLTAALAAKPDVVLHSTLSSLERVRDQLAAIVRSGVNVVSTCEELAYPWEAHPAAAKELDALAKRHQVTVLGTGVNPGFCMDTFPIVMTGVCQRVEKIRVRRIQDASSRRLPFQKKIGAGCTPAEFEALIASGALRHVGLRESADMIAAAMGWKLTAYTETIRPIMAEKETASQYLVVKLGQAAGVEQIASGTLDGKEVVRMEFQAYLGAPESYDAVSITGTPDVHATIQPGVQGDTATAAMCVNAMPRVIKAAPGLLTMMDLPPVHPYAGHWGDVL
jgi:4-hydroxy-tetrahydrodipicolinate reductase